MKSGTEAPPIFKRCSLDGLWKLLNAVQNPVAMDRLTRLYSSSSQAYKYVKLATGLRLVAVIMGAVKYERQGPWVKVYMITPQGKTLLDWLKRYDERNILESRKVFAMKFEEEAEPK